MRQFALILLPLLLSGCFEARQDAAPVVTYGGAPGAGSTGMHTVLDGDTVYTVSQQYNLPIRDIITLNAISAPYKLSVGYRIKLPPPNDYHVKKGDSLQSIAQTFDVSVSQLARMNNLSSPYQVREGQTLRLPSPQESVREDVAFQAPMKMDAVSRTPLPAPTASPQKTAAAPVPPRAPAAGAAKVAPASAATSPAKMPKTPLRADTGKFMWPVDGKVISGYGPKPGGLHNDGLNIKAPRGTPVRAAENGVVVYTGNKLEGYGNLVLVRHQDKWMTAYAHLDKTLIKKGDVVKRGQALGTVGSSGQVDAPQLHFEVRKGTSAVNPQSYL